MSAPRLSVVVVSAGRPEALRRCLTGLGQMAQAGCEVVVVADAAGLQVAERIGGIAKRLPQSEPNISAARNAGIAAAAGEIVAFLDDDAVPEPTWADAVCTAFAGSDIAAATGPVLGRNGISLQWGPLAVNGLAQDIPIAPNQPIRDGFHRKLQGTNMAFRRSVFTEIGGFDEAMRFYLDDTDMSVRIGEAGLNSAWVENAVVHHGFRGSPRRTEDRVPLSLHDIGASSAVFLRKHAPEADRADALRALEAGQSTRLLRLARQRKLDADRIRELMEGLKDGVEAGRIRKSVMPTVGDPPADFQAFRPRKPLPPLVLSGRPFQMARLRREAAAAVASGQPVSLFVFEPTPRKHKVRFTDGGWWEQTGGLFGPSDRAGPRFRVTSFRRRLGAEIRRISATRGLTGRGDRN